MTEKSILLDLPDQILTDRLIIRPPRAGDGAALRAAVVDSLDRLKVWFPWAQEAPSLDDEEMLVREKHARYLLREDFWFFLFDKETGKVIGGCGVHPRNWAVPAFEIGYWLRTGYEGKGFMSEAVRALTQFAFEQLGANRVMIRADERNQRSKAVALRCGYTYEGTLRNLERQWDDPSSLTDFAYYSMIRPEFEQHFTGKK
ncbi:MAG: GNAT family N-acetyltransferase [Anaerolineaceae bacterium]|nr:GNAT family N-acetyltransferase [Anaerolineaceae bacterium]